MQYRELQGNEVFVLDGFFSPEECNHLIARSEALGFDIAPITTLDGPVLNTNVRDNSRVMFDDPALAAELFDRSRPFLPATVRDWNLFGFNERWRVYRYDPGERFAPHYDGSFVRSDTEKSMLTFMVYLNGGFAGGYTNFYFRSENPTLTVEPEAGQALVFVHWKLHEGAPVSRGRKYVLRTDVMYRHPSAVPVG